VNNVKNKQKSFEKKSIITKLEPLLKYFGLLLRGVPQVLTGSFGGRGENLELLLTKFVLWRRLPECLILL